MWPRSRIGLAILQTLRDLFFPQHCAACQVSLPSDWLCGPCRDTLRPVHPPRCEVCSQPFSGAMAAFVCVNCQDRVFHFRCAVSSMQSRGVLRDLIHRFKYGGELWLSPLFMEFLEQGLLDERFEGVVLDAIVPVPLHALRKREREFNQAEILGQDLSKKRRIPLWNALERVRYTETQTHFDRQKRMQNLRDAFRLRQNVRVQGKHLLIVDDVFTTGSTLDECARVLLEAGAESVRALTLARG